MSLKFAGDLGVQRGVVRWFLSLHSPKHAFSISPKKLPKTTTQADGDAAAGSQETRMEVDDIGASQSASQQRAVTPDLSSVPPAPLPSTPVRKGLGSGGTEIDMDLPGPPPMFTPSINRTLNKSLPTQYHAPALPEGLTVAELKARLDGKKKVKCVPVPFQNCALVS